MNDAAVAAIQFALDTEHDGGMDFLRVWNQGDFPEIRKFWPEAPEEVFIGADPLHVPKQPQVLSTAPIATERSAMGAEPVDVSELQATAAAYKWAYGYLQDRMRSIGCESWAADCDGEIEDRINRRFVPRTPDPKNPQWCEGCNPDNCTGGCFDEHGNKRFR